MTTYDLTLTLYRVSATLGLVSRKLESDVSPDAAVYCRQANAELAKAIADLVAQRKANP